MEIKNQDQKQEEYVLIKKSSLSDLLKTSVRLTYMVKILEGVCHLLKVDVNLPVSYYCKVLGIGEKAFNSACKNNMIKYTLTGGTRNYSAYDMALLAEKITRRSRTKQLNKLPVILQEPPANENTPKIPTGSL